MDVSPMNLQVMIPKSTEVGQMQHNLNQQPVVQQDFETMRMKADANLKQNQVRSREKMEDGKIKDDPDRKKKQGQSGRHPRRYSSAVDEAAENQEERMAVDTFRGHHIDIKL